MFDCDVVIIGGGPAGLAAGLYLSRAKRRVILLEKETFGGPMVNYELIENYPGFSEGISGAKLASEMVTQATKYGLQIEQAEVTGIEPFSSCRCVECASGKSFTTLVVIIAGGSQPRKLGVPGEKEFQGKGVFNCAFCDGGQFSGKVVAVCGGGDAGISEALYMTKLASKVILVEAKPALTASAILQERALANPKLEVRCGTRVEKILGSGRVEGIELTESKSGRKDILSLSGILVHIGVVPNTGYLQDIVTLDSQGLIIVDNKMKTDIPYLFAAGDIRSGSPGQIVAAVGDGATAAIAVEKFLQETSI